MVWKGLVKCSLAGYCGSTFRCGGQGIVSEVSRNEYVWECFRIASCVHAHSSQFRSSIDFDRTSLLWFRTTIESAVKEDRRFIE